MLIIAWKAPVVVLIRRPLVANYSTWDITPMSIIRPKVINMTQGTPDKQNLSGCRVRELVQSWMLNLSNYRDYTETTRETAGL